MTEPFRVDISLALIEVPNELAECGDGFRRFAGGVALPGRETADQPARLRRRHAAARQQEHIELYGAAEDVIRKCRRSISSRRSRNSPTAANGEVKTVSLFYYRPKPSDFVTSATPAACYLPPSGGLLRRFTLARGTLQSMTNRIVTRSAQSHHQVVNMQVNNSASLQLLGESHDEATYTGSYWPRASFPPCSVPAPGFAGDFSAGKEASGEAPRAMGPASEFKGAKAKPVPGIRPTAAPRATSCSTTPRSRRPIRSSVGRATAGRQAGAERCGHRRDQERQGGRQAHASRRRRGRPRRLRCAARHRRQGQSRADHQFDDLFRTRRSAISRWRPRRVRCGAARRR